LTLLQPKVTPEVGEGQMNFIKFTTFSTALILLVFSFTNCTKKSFEVPKNEIVIGEYGSMTGAESTFGTQTHKGLMLAVDEINAKGGINAKKIRVINYDDQGKSDEAITAVTKLISQDHVQLIVGEVASSRSIAAGAIAQQYKVPMITPSSTNPKVTQIGDYIFRICFIDPFQGSVMAKFAFNNLHKKSAAILRDTKSDYSVGLADFFIQTFKAKGGTIVIDQSYSGGDIDFKSQLTSIKAKKPDVIFVPDYYTEISLIARQAKELKLTAPLLGGDK
jgi:branched-chain amino acid transport system substrate-binding protein